MAKPRAILKRAHAVRNIAKITKTMQMIATAKFKRAHDRAVAARPYTDRLKALIGELSAAAVDFDHPLLEAREPRRALVLAVASNRGLCGGYNAAAARLLLRVRHDLRDRGLEVVVQVAGKKLASILRFQRVAVDRLHTHFEDRPTFAQTDALAQECLRAFQAGEVDEVHVVYTKFLTSARQQPTAERVLPLVGPARAEGEEPASSRDYIFSPDPEAILSRLLPRSVRLHVFQAFLDAAVSEQTARMVAMKAATDNAYEMIRILTQHYNRSRQAQITTELSEIMGGAAALE